MLALERSTPRCYFEFSSIHRAVSHQALAAIFAELNVADFRQRLIVAREVKDAISRYWHVERTHRSPDFPEWFADIGKHAAALAALSDQAPKLFDVLWGVVGGSPHALAGLAAASSALGSLNARGRPRDRPIQVLVDRLARLYEARTGQEPSVGYDGVSEQPCGAFFHLVQATLTLAGESRTPDTLRRAIQRKLKLKRLRERKSQQGQK
jgi:hypothetical protein